MNRTAEETAIRRFHVAVVVGLVVTAVWTGAARPRPPHVDAEPLAIDPDTAPPAFLSCLPMVGPSLVGRIEEARSRSPIRDESDLDRIKGVGPATIALLRPFLKYGTDSGR